MTYGRELKSNWIEELARSELNMEESGVIDLGQTQDQKMLIEESAVELLAEMKDLFTVHAEAFNRLRSSHLGPQSLKIYHISGTIADFMLFRNAVKLIVSHSELGIIRISTAAHSANFSTGFGNMGPSGTVQHADEIVAQVAPFKEIVWTYQGQPIKLEFLVRHYLTEFIRTSAR